jgi:hypothetical protein
MNSTLRKVARITLWIAVALILAVGGLFLAIVQPGGSGVLASLRLPDGAEYMVTQHCNWSGEPYTVSFFMRAAGKPWGWCYIDHQAMRWRNVVMTYNAALDIITVTERGAWQATLDRKRNAFSIGNGKSKREVDAPQGYQEPEYAFP